MSHKLHSTKCLKVYHWLHFFSGEYLKIKCSTCSEFVQCSNGQIHVNVYRKSKSFFDSLSVTAVFVPSMVYCKRISAIDLLCDGLVEVYQLSRAVMLPVYELLRTNQRSSLSQHP